MTGQGADLLAEVGGRYGHRPMPRPTCAIVSFRLGLTDGVSVVAATWADILPWLGYDVLLVAGEGVGLDFEVPGLELGATHAPDPAAVEAALSGADLVVVENLCTIPMNLPAARAVAGALRGRPAILHHHDPPWQRPQWAHVTELPPDDPAWRHVTINRLTERELAERGITATTIYNGFRLDVRPGDRAATRQSLGVADDELLVAHPVRAIPRKDVPAAIRLAEALGATYWLLGPAEDGYGAELAQALAAAGTRVLHVAPPGSMAGAYAAADLIAFPSTWEGFGNPPIEAALHRRPIAVGHYPVAEDLREFGFQWFDPDDVAGIASFLAAPDESLLDVNERVAREHFGIDRVATDLDALLRAAGWRP
jgi:glycosyltransferase involved in cell wall biosynthesis